MHWPVPFHSTTLHVHFYFVFNRQVQQLTFRKVIFLHRESLSLRATSHPYHSNSLHNLANALQRHFGKTGSMTDLEEAILLYRESLSFRPTPHPDRFESLNNLACALFDRFEKTGSMTDLEKQFQCFVNRYPSAVLQPIKNVYWP
jgi:hypothetical protein